MREGRGGGGTREGREESEGRGTGGGMEGRKGSNNSQREGGRDRGSACMVADPRSLPPTSELCGHKINLESYNLILCISS